MQKSQAECSVTETPAGIAAHSAANRIRPKLPNCYWLAHSVYVSPVLAPGSIVSDCCWRLGLLEVEWRLRSDRGLPCVNAGSFTFLYSFGLWLIHRSS
mmetsp:Transcript_12023/g.20927  ORF Transcript_12023/g.20927 Transcript_12023/m.20927 type:complete len:98 (-) Transcript_12023:3750-4043(-)